MLNATTRNNITSLGSTNITYTRTFTIEEYPLSIFEASTISGFPTSDLTESCGFADAQPAQEGKVCFLRFR